MSHPLIGSFPQFIDSSMMAAYKSCPTLFRLSHIEHWKPKGVSVHLHAGGAFAFGLEVTRRAFWEGKYQHWKRVAKDMEEVKPGDTVFTKLELEGVTESEPGNAEDSIAAGLIALLAYYGEFECPPDSAKSADRTAGAFEFYFDNYPLQYEEGKGPILLASGRRAIEFSFAEPCDVAHPVTGDPILVVGRADAIEHLFGGTFVVDEKTTSSLGPTWSKQWDLRAQFTGYCWAARRVGIRIDGAVVRGVSILKTKYDTQQVPSYRPDWQVDRWYAELCNWLEEMKWRWANNNWPHNLDHACVEYGGCSFKDICLSQTPQSYLDTYFERRFWNPVARTETKLFTEEA